MHQDSAYQRLNFLIHLICWGLVFQFLFNFVGLYYAFYDLFILDTKIIDEAFLLIPSILLLFYTNSLLLTPTYLAKKKILQFIMGIIGLYLIYIWLLRWLYEYLEAHDYHFRINWSDMNDILIQSGLFTLIMSTTVGLVKTLQENTRQKKQAIEAQKEAELKYLNAQINPHFLFNTLNALYALSDEEDAGKTTAAILKLSAIMRYPLKEGSQEKVPLNLEIEFIENYIGLQHIRLGNDYPIIFNTLGITESKMIAPLLFIPLVENAFKYGISRINPKPILIDLKVDDHQLELTIENAIFPQSNLPSQNMGIENVKHRLSLLYPDQHQLEIKQSNDQFKIRLTLKA